MSGYAKALSLDGRGLGEGVALVSARKNAFGAEPISCRPTGMNTPITGPSPIEGEGR